MFDFERGLPFILSTWSSVTSSGMAAAKSVKKLVKEDKQTDRQQTIVQVTNALAAWRTSASKCQQSVLNLLNSSASEVLSTNLCAWKNSWVHQAPGPIPTLVLTPHKLIKGKQMLPSAQCATSWKSPSCNTLLLTTQYVGLFLQVVWISILSLTFFYSHIFTCSNLLIQFIQFLPNLLSEYLLCCWLDFHHHCWEG